MLDEPFVVNKRFVASRPRLFYLVVPYHPSLALSNLTRDIAELEERWKCELHYDLKLDGIRISWKAAGPNLLSLLRRANTF